MAGLMVSPYSDGSAYDALVDDFCFPTTGEPSEDELGRTPASARRHHFATVAGSFPAPTVRHGRQATAPDNPSAPPRPTPRSEGGVAAEENLRGARHHPGAA